MVLVFEEKPFLAITEKFDLQTSYMQTQCNFLTYRYQESSTVDYVSIFVCNKVRVISLFWSLEFLFNP